MDRSNHRLDAIRGDAPAPAPDEQLYFQRDSARNPLGPRTFSKVMILRGFEMTPNQYMTIEGAELKQLVEEEAHKTDADGSPFAKKINLAEVHASLQENFKILTKGYAEGHLVKIPRAWQHDALELWLSGVLRRARAQKGLP